jgi:glycerate dehydrogenase
MTIGVLDGHTLNPGDISWEHVAALGEMTVHPRTPADQIVARSANADILMTNKVPITAETLAQLPRLKCICVLATGVNVVDVAAARGRGVVVCNVPEYSTQSVAQLVFALLLEMCHHVGRHYRLIHAGEWAKREWCFWETPQVELAGKTLGIVGYGRIGKNVAAIGRAMGMKVLAFSRTQREAASAELAWGSVEEIFAQADVVSLHLPLTPETKGMVNARLLGTMKRNAFLINTARGPLINDADLAAALHAGTLAGAALDVTSVEPINGDNPLLKAPNCIITPHYAWATLAARKRLMVTAEENVAAFLVGKPKNIVN